LRDPIGQTEKTDRDADTLIAIIRAPTEAKRKDEEKMKPTSGLWRNMRTVERRRSDITLS